jgi:hypothetical protein
VSAEVLSIAASAGFVLAGASTGLFCLWRAGALLRALGRPVAAEAAMEVVQQKLEALEQEIQLLRRHGPPAAVPAPPRAGFNLEKRSHALRMHRRGEPVSQIATVLDLPVQEVDLLLKVHRIVLRNI